MVLDYDRYMAGKTYLYTVANRMDLDASGNRLDTVSETPPPLRQTLPP